MTSREVRGTGPHVDDDSVRVADKGVCRALTREGERTAYVVDQFFE
jgi:hypothetical protein